MFKVVSVIASSFLFTLLGIAAAVVIVLNRPHNFDDRTGFTTTMMVLVPTAGGLAAGLFVGMVAASYGPSAK